MGESTNIEWCDHTFNAWWACTKISPACDNCYAEKISARFGGPKWGAGEPRRRTSPANWRQPLKWNREAEKTGKRPRVFCNSMSDVFDNEVPVEWLVDLLYLVKQTPNLDWLQLTKRIGNVRSRLNLAAEKIRSVISGAQTERKVRLSIGVERGAGDRPVGNDLASQEASCGSMGQGNESGPVHSSQGGNRERIQLPSSSSYVGREAPLCVRPPAGVVSPKRRNPDGSDNKPQGRGEEQQFARESGVGDLQRTEDSRDQNTGGKASRRERLETSENFTNGSSGFDYSEPKGVGRASKGSGEGVRINGESCLSNCSTEDMDALLIWLQDWLTGEPPANVSLGITICNQPEANRDVWRLIEIPVARRFLSIEPMLGPIDLMRKVGCGDCDPCHGGGKCAVGEVSVFPSIDEVIVGGESGPGARPMHPYWVRSIRDQCAAAGVPFMFKQWGEWKPRQKLMGGDQDLYLEDPSCEKWQCLKIYECGAVGYVFGDGEPAYMQRVGKKAAGRLLDGVEHNGVCDGH